jgi:RNA polymerase sigma factor (sigma-70 family)
MRKDYAASFDTELWSAFKMGDEGAFAQIYEQYAGLLYSYGTHLCKDEELVKDHIHTLFLDLWTSREDLGETSSIKFYLFKSIKRRIYKALTVKNRFQSTEDIVWEDDFKIVLSHESNLIAAQATAEQMERLQQAINRLTKRQKEAIYLTYYSDLSYPEVAALMSLKVTTVYDIIYDAMKELRKTVQKVGLMIVLAGACLP